MTKAGHLAGLILWLGLAACAGGGGTPPAGEVTGASTCAEADRQDLTFKGGFVGHVRCTVEPAICLLQTENPAHGGSYYYRALLKARRGSLPLALYVGAGGFTYRGPGQYTIPRGAGANTSSVEVDVGPAKSGSMEHWLAAAGGTVAVTADDPRALSGTINVRLEAPGHDAARLTGQWSCLKVVAPAPPG